MSFIKYLVRGDKLSLTLPILKDNKPIIFGDNDQIVFNIKLPNTRYEDSLLKEIYTKEDIQEDNTININISSETTLRLRPGIYYFSLKYIDNTTTKEPQLHTIIYDTKLVIFD